MPHLPNEHFLKSGRPLRVSPMVAAMVTAILVGIILLIVVLAAGNFGAAEIESGSLTSGAQVVSASSASGGKAVEFGVSTPAPTPEPTPPPTTTQNLHCAASPHLCGFPDATNTGPQSSANLIQVPAQATSGTNWACEATKGNNCSAIQITGNVGSATTGLRLASGIIVDVPDGHSNFVIDNIAISGVSGQSSEGIDVGSNTCQAEGCGPNNVTIENCSITGGTGASRGWAAVYFEWQTAGSKLENCNLSGFSGPVFYVGENGQEVTTGNYIHNLECWDFVNNDACDAANSSPSNSDHCNSIGDGGGPPNTTSSWLIQHNTVMGDGLNMSSNISLFPDGSPQLNDHVTIDDNLLSGGNYLINNGGGDTYGSDGQSYVIVTNNHYSTLYGPNAGYYGIFYLGANNVGTGTGDVQSGNLWDDGTHAGQSADGSNYYP